MAELLKGSKAGKEEILTKAHANEPDAHGATPAMIPGRIVLRDDEGRVHIGDPSEDTHGATKAYVDAHAEDQTNPHNVTKEQVGLDQVENVLQASKEDFDAHVEDQNNPHNVTKEQVGLDQVENVLQASKEDFDAHVGDQNNPHNVTVEQIGAASEEALATHIAAKNNPHGVTKVQVGLSNVTNDRQATKADFDAHVANKNNPHGVTKAQVGLSNVTNDRQATKAEFDAHVANKNNPHNVTAAQIGAVTQQQVEAMLGDASVKWIVPSDDVIASFPTTLRGILGRSRAAFIYVTKPGRYRIRLKLHLDGEPGFAEARVTFGGGDRLAGAHVLEVRTSNATPTEFYIDSPSGVYTPAGGWIRVSAYMGFEAADAVITDIRLCGREANEPTPSIKGPYNI